MDSRKLYMDAALLFDLAEEPANSDSLLGISSEQNISIVLSLPHVFEAVRLSEAGRNGTGAFLDDLLQSGRACWIRHLNNLVALEAENLLRMHLGLPGHEVSPFSPVITDAFLNRPPAHQIGILRSMTVVDVLNLLESTDRTELQEMTNSVPTQFEHLRESRKVEGQRRSSHRRLRQQLRFVLPASLQTSSGLVVRPSPETIEGFLGEVEVSFETCPAFYATQSYFDGVCLQDGGDRPSDFWDFFHLVGLAYCDFFFADRTTVDRLGRAGIPKEPMKNGDFPKWLSERKGKRNPGSSLD